MPRADADMVRRDITRQFLSDSDEVDQLLEDLAQGGALRTLCEDRGLTYSTVQRFLAEHYTDAYEAAKAVRAEQGFDDLEELEEKLKAGDDTIGFNEFRELSKSIQWRIERLNPKRYSPKQTIDMQVTDKTKLHLEALRTLTQRKRQAITVDAVASGAHPALTHGDSNALKQLSHGNGNALNDVVRARINDGSKPIEAEIIEGEIVPRSGQPVPIEHIGQVEHVDHCVSVHSSTTTKTPTR